MVYIFITKGDFFLWTIMGNDDFITKNIMLTLWPFPKVHNSFHKILNVVILIT